MRLADLLNDATADVEITGLTADSRAVQPGYLFAALPGRNTDGRAFIPQAVEAGASAVMLQAQSTLAAAIPSVVAVVEEENPRQAFAHAAARFYGRQPRTVCAVTGTNGKTSTAVFTRQLWSALGYKAASVGTLGAEGDGYERPGSLTTPDPVTLHSVLAEAAQAGITHLCMEASSHGLDQFRVDGVKLTAAAFTNLSRDHLDYHGTMENYLAAKARLFSEVVPEGGTAVLHADIPEYEELRRAAQSAGRKVMSYGFAGDDIKLISRTVAGDGQRLELRIDGSRHVVELPLVGTFQAANLLAALGLVIAGGAPVADAVAAVASIKGVPGRLEKVGERENGASVFVDYAHTPDALETVLKALRPHAPGRLIVVFGCGGDRDKGKRPLMAEVCGMFADVVIVTDDNPRSEDPATIRQETTAGYHDAIDIGDRRRAIFEAAAMLEAGDLLLVAGKGHETGQTVGAQVLPFDDRIVSRQAIEDADR